MLGEQPISAQGSDENNPAPARIRLMPVTYNNGVWVWDEQVRPEPQDIPYANAVDYVRADTVQPTSEAVREAVRVLDSIAVDLENGFGNRQTMANLARYAMNLLSGKKG